MKINQIIAKPRYIRFGIAKIHIFFDIDALFDSMSIVSHHLKLIMFYQYRSTALLEKDLLICFFMSRP